MRSVLTSMIVDTDNSQKLNSGTQFSKLDTRSRIDASIKAGIGLPSFACPDIGVAYAYYQTCGCYISVNQWFDFFCKKHKVDTVGMPVLVPCDGTFGERVKAPKGSHSSFACYYGIVIDTCDDGTVCFLSFC